MSSRRTSPLTTTPRVINPENKLRTPVHEFSLRDKAKLLQLADKIHITNKKSPISSSIRIKTNKLDKSVETFPLTPGLILPSKNFECSAETPKNRESSLKSFNRSKLYSSLSPKKRSLQKLAKKDPAKTNIEHLVNHKIVIGPSESLPLDNSGIQASFHDKAKLTGAFGPKSKNKEIKNEFSPGFKQSLLPIQRHETGFATKIATITEKRLNGAEKEELLGKNSANFICENDEDILFPHHQYRSNLQPKISSAHIIPLARKNNSLNNNGLTELRIRTENIKKNDSDQNTSVAVTSNLPPIDKNIVKSKPEAPSRVCSSSVDENEHFEISQRISEPHIICKKGEKFKHEEKSEDSLGFKDNYNDRQRFSKILLPQNKKEVSEKTKFYANGEKIAEICYQNYESVVSESSEPFNVNPQHQSYRNEKKEMKEHPPILTSRSLNTYLVQTNKNLKSDKSSTNNNEATNLINDEIKKFMRKRSSSLPKSFYSQSIHLVGNENCQAPPKLLVKDDLSIQRFLRNNNKNDLFEKSKDERRMTVSYFEEGDAISSSDLVKEKNKIRTPSRDQHEFAKIELRPKSLDHTQKNIWINVHSNMDAQNSQSQLASHSCSKIKNISPLKKQVSRNSNLTITHLHLVEPSQISIDCENGGNEKNSMVSSSLISPKYTPSSLFHRFSKTFSLRFGNSRELNSSEKNEKSHQRIIAAGSSPDIYSRIKNGDMNRNTCSSSGKMRKSDIKSTRVDKCQSGDSAIQLSDECILTSSSRTSPEYLDSSNHSPVSMKKLSLVEIPNQMWSSKPDPNKKLSPKTRGITKTIPQDDDGFVSNDDEEVEKMPSSLNYYHSLPLKYSKQRKAELLQLEKKKEAIRGNVVREIISTEQNYVKALNDIVQGFLRPFRARTDLFTHKIVQNIFSNIEDILRLHAQFLNALKENICDEDYAGSAIGHVFLDWADKFKLYSEYCCNNPLSMATVRQLSLSIEYNEFFEECRKLQLMDKLPLHGFLLRPVQRICQYHLQLNELLKYTPSTHKDFIPVSEALDTMKAVAMQVNDTQKRFDALQEIVRLQNSFDFWAGPDLIPRNSTIIHRGDLAEMKQGHKLKEIHLVLLNNEVLICKKDSLGKKSSLSLTSRIDMSSTVWVNIDSNEEDDYFGMVHNSWRVFDPMQNIWILLTAPSPPEKKKWTSMFEKMSEEHFYDPKMAEMAKITAIKTLLVESHLQSLSSSQMSSSSYSNNSGGGSSSTLPRLRKNKNKNSLSKTDSDLQGIEVSKLKKTNCLPPASTASHLPKTSKFYV